MNKNRSGRAIAWHRLIFSGVLLLSVSWLVGCNSPSVKTDGASQDQTSEASTATLYTCSMHPYIFERNPGRCPVCGMELVPVARKEEASSSAVLIDPTVVQNLGIRLQQVRSGDLTRVVKAAGFVEEAQTHIVDVNLRVSGWIEKLYAHTEGMLIEKGSPLFELYSPELYLAIEEARSSGSAGESKSISRLQAITKEKLLLLGVTTGQIETLLRQEQTPRTISILSPISGHVVERNVVQGAAVTAGEKVLRLVDHSTLWLDVRIFEKDFSLVRLGSRVNAQIEAFPEKLFAGKVLFVHPHFDATTRTGLIRIELLNQDLRLRPGMFAKAEIETEPIQGVLTVPQEAVIQTGRRNVVFVSSDAKHFEPREVEIGRYGSNGDLEVLSGLKVGEQIVLSGQFLIDAESRFQEAIQKFVKDQAGKSAIGHQH